MSKQPDPDPALYGLPASPECPFCDRSETYLMSAFGPQLSVATYWCRPCHTAFEFMKWKATDDPTSGR